MRLYSIDYSKDRGERGLLNRGFWVHDIPRIVALCRLLGHKPVVDGTKGIGDLKPSRWVACDRCGTRTDPQGRLDPAVSDIGDRYVGPHDGHKNPHYLLQNPGPWPASLTGTVGGQLVIGGRVSSNLGIGFKVGNPGSEHVLSGNLCLGPLGALYLHTENHGRWLQRRLNPTGYDSRVIEVSIHHGCLYWQLWARRDESRASDPWWMSGSLRVDPRHYLLGKRTVVREPQGEPVDGRVCMPDGTVHDVRLSLEKWTTGRQRGRKTERWVVDWSSKAGISFRNHSWKGDEVFGSSVDVPHTAVENDQWVQLACARIAADCARDRARHNYRPTAA
ncbi:hypothetical protein [Streptomyces sp. FxanaA7]|uniref:hypothetical protein n=1 Tax=Streptomyces sp. FxanaA7 TaxID=1265492 RepID=UPI0005EE0F76|nr:hypothetical protein [Streptomyces sp. FxanaA7]